MRKLILLLLFSYFLLSFGFADGEEQLAGDEISLVLDLEASFYTFGLSSNPINSATTQPNDVVPTLQPVGSEGNIIGVMGGIQGNENDNELHFYWNVSSPLEFSVFIGVDTSGEGEGAMKKVAGTGAGSYLDWTISVVGETEQIKKGEYGQKNVAAGVPAVIGKNGVEEIFEIDLNEREKQEFDRSCDVIRGYLRQAEEMLK